MYKNECVDYAPGILAKRVTVQDVNSFLSQSKISQDNLESLKSLMIQLQNVQLKYFKNQIYINSTKEVIEDNELKSYISLKARRILNFRNIDSFVKWDKISNSGQLILGLTTQNIIKLSYEEGLFIKELLEPKIKKKHSSCMNILKKYGKNMDFVESLTINVLNIDFEPFKLKVQLDNLENIYIEHLLKLTNILQEFLNIRLKTFYDQSIKLHENLNASKKVLELKSKILNINIKKEIFCSTPLARNAYNIAQGDLSKEKENLSTEITKLQKELNILENMSNNPELHTLFKKYIHIMDVLKTRKHLLE